MYLINLPREHVISGGFFRHSDVSEYRQGRPSEGATVSSQKDPEIHPDLYSSGYPRYSVHLFKRSQYPLIFGNVEPPVGADRGEPTHTTSSTA